MKNQFTIKIALGSLISMLAWSAPSEAQIVVQRVLDLESPGAPFFCLARTTDEGTAICVKMDQELVIVKYNAALDPLWASSIQTPAFGSLGAAESGGVIAASMAGFYSAPPDTEMVFVDVHKIDATGAPVWSREVTVQVSEAASNASVGRGIWSDAAGNIFFTLGFPGAAGYAVSLDPLGSIRWATGLLNHGLYLLLPDGNGGCFAAGNGSLGNDELLRIAHLDETGQAVYSKSINYQSQDIVRPTDMQLVGTDLVLFINHQGTCSILKLDPTGGDPLACDFYVVDPPPPLGTPFRIRGGSVMNNGEILLVGGYGGSDGKATTFRLTADGLPLAGFSFNTQASHDWRSSFEFDWLAADADEVTVLGEFWVDDLLIPEHVRHAFLWHLPSDLSAACGAVPISFAHQSFPVAQLDVADLMNVDSTQASSSTTTTAPLPHPTIASNDFCVLLSAADITAEGTDQLFTLSTQVLFAGDSFSVNLKEDVALSILDPSGRSILAVDAARGQFAGIPTETWGAGLYLVHARSDTGKSQAKRFLLVR